MIRDRGCRQKSEHDNLVSQEISVGVVSSHEGDLMI